MVWFHEVELPLNRVGKPFVASTLLLRTELRVVFLVATCWIACSRLELVFHFILILTYRRLINQIVVHVLR